jgi:hypothetical protein
MAVVGNLPQLHEIWIWWVPPQLLHENHGVGVSSTIFGADPRWSCWSWLCLADKFWSGVDFLDLELCGALPNTDSEVIWYCQLLQVKKTKTSRPLLAGQILLSEEVLKTNSKLVAMHHPVQKAAFFRIFFKHTSIKDAHTRSEGHFSFKVHGVGDNSRC